MPTLRPEELVQSFVTPGRFHHILRVAETAQKLAEHWGLDPNQAHQAGIFHDIAKSLNPHFFQVRNIALSSYLKDIYKDYRNIFHAFAGPLIATYFGGVTDPEILGAIKWHTTGRANLSQIEQIIFISDYLEPSRTIEHRALLTDLAKTDLSATTFWVSAAGLTKLIRKGVKIHPFSVQCYHFYLSGLSAEQVRTYSDTRRMNTR